MNRISDLSSHNLMVRTMLQTQQRMYDAERQVSTEKQAQRYSGIANQSERLVNLEHSLSRIKTYGRINDTIGMRYQVAEDAVGAAKSSMTDFRQQLRSYSSGGSPTSENAVNDIQTWAHRSLKNMEDYLNTEVNGEYIFSGSSTKTAPADLKLGNTLKEFQDRYDGSTRQVPTTREAHLGSHEFDSADLEPLTPEQNAIKPGRDSRLAFVNNATNGVGDQITLSGDWSGRLEPDTTIEVNKPADAVDSAEDN